MQLFMFTSLRNLPKKYIIHEMNMIALKTWKSREMSMWLKKEKWACDMCIHKKKMIITIIIDNWCRGRREDVATTLSGEATIDNKQT